jgi:hypothetical protein
MQQTLREGGYALCGRELGIKLSRGSVDPTLPVQQAGHEPGEPPEQGCHLRGRENGVIAVAGHGLSTSGCFNILYTTFWCIHTPFFVTPIRLCGQWVVKSACWAAKNRLIKALAL